MPASESSGSLDSAHEASASRAPTPDDDDDGVGVTAVAQLPDDVPHVEVYAATERGREGASVGKGDSEVSAAEDVDGGSSRPPEAQVLSTVFQLGIFLRVLRPARTVLHHARLSSGLPKLFIKKIVFSDSRCKNACNCLQICARVFINRPQNCAQTSFHSHAAL